MGPASLPRLRPQHSSPGSAGRRGTPAHGGPPASLPPSNATFVLGSPRANSTPGGGPAALWVSTFRLGAKRARLPAPNLPRGMPAQCSAGARRPPAAASLPPEPAGAAAGARGALPPPSICSPRRWRAGSARGPRRQGAGPARALPGGGRERAPALHKARVRPPTKRETRRHGRVAPLLAPTCGPGLAREGPPPAQDPQLPAVTLRGRPRPTL